MADNEKIKPFEGDAGTIEGVHPTHPLLSFNRCFICLYKRRGSNVIQSNDKSQVQTKKQSDAFKLV